MGLIFSSAGHKPELRDLFRRTFDSLIGDADNKWGSSKEIYHILQIKAKSFLENLNIRMLNPCQNIWHYNGQGVSTNIHQLLWSFNILLACITTVDQLGRNDKEQVAQLKSEFHPGPLNYAGYYRATFSKINFSYTEYNL